MAKTKSPSIFYIEISVNTANVLRLHLQGTAGSEVYAITRLNHNSNLLRGIEAALKANKTLALLFRATPPAQSTPVQGIDTNLAVIQVLGGLEKQFPGVRVGAIRCEEYNPSKAPVRQYAKPDLINETITWSHSP